MASEFEIERRCSYEKRSGIVQLSPLHLLWTPDSNADGDGLQIPITSIRQYQVTKAGSAKKAMIRLTCSDRDGAVKLDFARAFNDRDAVRNVLMRLQTGGAAAGGSGAPGGPSAPRIAAPAKPVSAEARRWRMKLFSHKEVSELHMRLVMQSGAVSDDAFWDAMKYRFKPNGDRRPTAAAAAAAAPGGAAGAAQGVPSDAFAAVGGPDADADAGTWKDGTPNAAQRHKVFMDHPAIARAHHAMVPRKRTDAEFWRTFLQTSIAAKLTRSRGRRSAATATEADAVFAEFLTQEERQAERQAAARAARLSRAIDLDRFDDHRSPHVLEGHGGTADAPRLHKRPAGAGRDLPMSSSLRVMRQVNRHGTLIVDKAAGDRPVQTWQREAEERGAPLDDLIEREKPKFTALGVGAIKKAAPVIRDAGEMDASPMDVDAGQVQDLAEGLRMWDANTDRLMYTQPDAGGVLVELLGQMRP